MGHLLDLDVDPAADLGRLHQDRLPVAQLHELGTLGRLTHRLGSRRGRNLIDDVGSTAANRQSDRDDERRECAVHENLLSSLWIA